MMQMYANLSQCLKEVNPVTCKPRLDRFGFQAADIIPTLQLLRTVVLSTTGGSIADRCHITNEVVMVFIPIPTTYHHAISVPLLFHLGVIGQLLGSTLEQPLSEGDYSSIREVSLSMVQLFSTLEGLHASKGASERLRVQVGRIDDYMMTQRQDSGVQIVAGDISASQIPPEQFGATMYSAQDSTTSGRTLAPFYHPSELLGDFSHIFDFAGLPQS